MRGPKDARTGPVSELIRKDELASAVEARRELGPEYEDEVLNAFLEKVEQRLDARPKAVSRGPERGLAVPLGSLGIAIPLVGAAGSVAGLAGVIAVCLAIVLVNLAYAFRR